MTIRYVVGWVLTVVLSCVFVFAGWGQATSAPFFVGMWSAFGYPHWFMVLTGLLEIAAAALLIAPRTVWYGAGQVCAIMLGAFVTHLTHGQSFQAVMPAILGVLAIASAALRGSLKRGGDSVDVRHHA